MSSGLQDFLGSWLQRTSFSAQSRDAMALATAVPEGRALLRNRIAMLDVEIPVLENALKTLLEERKWAQEQLDAYAYPVLTLPNEVVSDIFLQYIPPYPERPPLLGDASPTNLLQICRRWREIALSTPALWRAFQPRLGFWRQGGPCTGSGG
ncbi:F-box domain-containing protein [Mycena chlorophos]|uniref:F-box domain-containing protein n=1 Tax=Mycena chlorophos TaxID=658473 RepID=A0A8H6TS30_MYCCL|nr:F-box domain-containing protein [Mycena chlorophos]